MAELLLVPMKIAIAIFIAGGLLEMGLRLDPRDALAGLRNVRFVAYTLLWGFVLGPALAYAITRVIPLERPYATGLVLLGMAPCAPFLPMVAGKAKGDPGYTAAIMLLTAAGTVAFMPLAVPLLAKGLDVSAWSIARPMLAVIFFPLAAGMLVLGASPALASRLLPFARTITGIAMVATVALCLAVYGEVLLGVPGSLAVVALLAFFFVPAAFSYRLAFGLRHEQRVVLSAAMTTRNLGAALVPLLAVAQTDERSVVMVVLSLPIMVMSALLSARWFSRMAAADPCQYPGQDSDANLTEPGKP